MSGDSFARRLIGIPWPPLLAMALIASLLLAFFVRRNGDERPTAPAARLTVLVSGDTDGVLYAAPCGPGQSGGLARRGSILDDLRKKGPLLYFDLGNAAAGATPYDRLTFAAILRGEAAMGIAAHNLGPHEIALGGEEIRRLSAELKIPFLSTNVRDSEGRPLAEPLRIVEVGGRQIAVAGIISPEYRIESVQVLDPAESIAAALAERREPYDRLLVLAYLSGEELPQLAARLPEKSLLVGPGSVDPSAVEGNVAGVVGRQGTSLVRIDLAGDSKWTSTPIAVDAALPEQRAQVENMVAYHQELAAHDFAADTTGRAMALPVELSSATRVAGVNACRTCHPHECVEWDNTAHAVAWQSLWNRGVHYDAACQRCHTTGYGWEGGFQSVQTVATWNVGCESCHGPSMAHVLNPSIRTPLIADQQCAECHDADRSPGFNYESAWRRIQHGGKAATNPGF